MMAGVFAFIYGVVMFLRASARVVYQCKQSVLLFLSMACPKRKFDELLSFFRMDA
jgi:hypothetical protein